MSAGTMLTRIPLLTKQLVWNEIARIHSSPAGSRIDTLLATADSHDTLRRVLATAETQPPLAFDRSARPMLARLVPPPVKRAWGPLAVPHAVNLIWWDRRDASDQGDVHRGNLGDMLSPVIVEAVANTHGLSQGQRTSRTRYLVAIGSLLGQYLRPRTTVWGTGVEPTYVKLRNPGKTMSTFDFRAVRGPLTARYLQDRGVLSPSHALPFGDPAVLLPLFYAPTRENEASPLAILHEADPIPMDSPVRIMSVLTEDWRASVDTIASASLVVSTSLHGIILAEAYGVPAIMINSPRVNARFKFEDWYLSTGRPHYPIAHSIDDALTLTAPPLPELTAMQETLLEAFPFDLWD